MCFFYRHRIVFGLTAIALAVVVTFGICFFALSRTAAQAQQKLTVVIDAGHGGIDGGVVGRTSGVKESDINLAISRYLQAEFEEAGFQVIQTRLTESGLYGAATSGYKRRDMQKRAEIINESNPALMISVHQNFFSLTSRRGAQVFFREDSAASETLAGCIQTALNDMPEATRKYAALKGDYYVLNCSDYPSVIVECGFLSNPEDEALLITSEYQQKVASVIAYGALTYLASGAAALA